MQKHGEMRQSGCYGNFMQFCESGIQGVDGAVPSEGQEKGKRRARAAHAGPRCLEFIHNPPRDLHTH